MAKPSAAEISPANVRETLLKLWKKHRPVKRWAWLAHTTSKLKMVLKRPTRYFLIKFTG